MRLAIALVLLFIIPVSATINESEGDQLDQMSCPKIDFDASDLIILPRLSLDQAQEVTGPSCSFPRYVPVFLANQSISGALVLLQNGSQADRSGPWALNISVCLSEFSLASFLDRTPGPVNVSGIICSRAVVLADGEKNATNATQVLRFQIEGAAPGMYSLRVSDESVSGKRESGESGEISSDQCASVAMISHPLLITDAKIAVDAPENVSTDEPFIPFKVNMTSQDNASQNASSQNNASRFFAALMISRSDYENITLTISGNGSDQGFDLSVSLNGRNQSIPYPPSLSTELLMGMLSILPQNSAVAAQESSGNGAELVLMTEGPWARGEYILTCGVYSPGRGLLGIKQKTIEVI